MTLYIKYIKIPKKKERKETIPSANDTEVEYWHEEGAGCPPPVFICPSSSYLWSAPAAVFTHHSLFIPTKSGFPPHWYYPAASSITAAAAAAKSLQSCPTLCDPIDSSQPGSPIPGILQARTLEWVVISFSNAWKWKVKVKSLNRVRHFATPWTAAHQTPPKDLLII